LFEFSRPYKNLITKLVGPKATGFQTDLYSFPELPPDIRHVLESRFFNSTDQLASDALDRLYAANNNWTPTLRSAWSRFVINFRMRHPDPLTEMRGYIEKTWNNSDRYYEAEYAKIRKPEHPETLAEYTASLGPETGQKIQLRLLQSTFDNERLGERLNAMQWDVLDTSNANFPLLTSDWPCDLALSRDTELLRQLQRSNRKRIVQITNKYVVSKARRYVYAHDKSQTNFIDKYMSKDMFAPPFWPSLGSTHAAALRQSNDGSNPISLDP
jgi:hypothetical protein